MGGKKNDKLHKGSTGCRSGGLRNNKRYTIDNSGYSLIELVIVLAIIAIIMSTVFYSIILIFSANAKSCANNIQRAIGDCKVTTMGKASAYMTLYRNAEGNVYTQMHVMNGSGIYEDSEAQKVGTQKVYVAYRAKTAAPTDPPTELLPNTSIEIWFDRATGGFKADKSGNLYKGICVEGGSKKYEIELTELTGKSEVKVK